MERAVAPVIVFLVLLVVVVIVSLGSLVAVAGTVALRGNGNSVGEPRFSWEDERKEPLAVRVAPFARQGRNGWRGARRRA